MPDAIEWVGFLLASLIIGGFLGGISTGGTWIGFFGGFLILFILSAIYLLTIGHQEMPPRDPVA